jgi:hypothetical protein
MSLLTHIGHFFKDVGRDIQYRFEGAVMDLGDFARSAANAQGRSSCDDVPDLLASKASFERMLRLLEEKRIWPEESLRLEDDADFDDWRNWPMPAREPRLATAAAL